MFYELTSELFLSIDPPGLFGLDQEALKIKYGGA